MFGSKVLNLDLESIFIPVSFITPDVFFAFLPYRNIVLNGLLNGCISGEVGGVCVCVCWCVCVMGGLP